MTPEGPREGDRQAPHPRRSARPLLPALLALLDVPVEGRDWRPSTRPSAAGTPTTRLSVWCSGRATPSPLPDLRGSALDRRRDPGRARRRGRGPSRRQHPAPGELPARVPPYLERQDVLRPGPDDPLPEASATELLDALLGVDASLGPLTPLLVERTEGNPFFIEESVRALVETSMLAGHPGRYRVARPLGTIQVPPTVQAVLAARIDRLPPDAKSLLHQRPSSAKTCPSRTVRDRGASRGGPARRARALRPPSSSTRRDFSPISNTPSSTR